jgi:hypothetical protein
MRFVLARSTRPNLTAALPPCSRSGHCGDTHCYCDRYYSGPYCTISSAPTKGGGTKSAAAASPRLRQRSAAALSLASAALVLTALL